MECLRGGSAQMCNELIGAILDGGRHDLLTCGRCGREVPLQLHELYGVYFAKLEVERAAHDAERAAAEEEIEARALALQSVAPGRGRQRGSRAERQPVHARPHGG